MADAINDSLRRYQRYLSNQRILKSRWVPYSNCKDLSPQFMYPVSASKQVVVSQTVCWDCEVRQECLELALVGNETEGVWGGTTELERRQLFTWIRSSIDPRESWGDEEINHISKHAKAWIERNSTVPEST